MPHNGESCEAEFSISNSEGEAGEIWGRGGGGGVKAHSPLPFPKHKELLGGKSLQFSYSPFPLPTGKSVPPFLLKLRPRVRLEFDGL